MKQRITPDQLNELSDKGKEKLRKWWKPSEGDLCDLGGEHFVTSQEAQNAGWAWDRIEIYPLLSIGQMIEFLSEDSTLDFWIDRVGCWTVTMDHGKQRFSEWEREEGELADLLWQAVKEVLEVENA